MYLSIYRMNNIEGRVVFVMNLLICRIYIKTRVVYVMSLSICRIYI